jgi:hypothetical protein
VTCHVLRYLEFLPTRRATPAPPPSTRAAQPSNSQNDSGNASLAQAQSHKLRHRGRSARGRLSGGAVRAGEAGGGEAAHDRRAHREREVRDDSSIETQSLILLVLAYAGDLHRTRKTAPSLSSPSSPPRPRTYSMRYPSSKCWKSCRDRRQSGYREVWDQVRLQAQRLQA